DLEPPALPLGDQVAGALEQVLDALAGEEAQVALVEQALLAVAEGAAEQREANARMRDVRDRGDHDAVLGNQRAHALQEGSRVAQVLEHVGEDDGVEALGAELGLEVEL